MEASKSGSKVHLVIASDEFDPIEAGEPIPEFDLEYGDRRF
jgi:hypothetical protein